VRFFLGHWSPFSPRQISVYDNRVLRIIDVRDYAVNGDYESVVPRGEVDIESVVPVVQPVLDAVRERGEEALREYSQAFDHIIPDSFRVDPAIVERALAETDPDLRHAIEVAIERRRLVAQAEADSPDRVVELAQGATVTIRDIPVERVGLYVPGGLAPLASSVIMNVVPAHAAGVRSLAVASPPQAEFAGLPHPTILATCALLGVDEIYAVGGAQAIAMFGYGVDRLCSKVDLITGPGNIYVAAAKRLLRGQVGIDAEAGPTEIIVMADSSATPQFVAADLLSQAEHDRMAGSVLVTDSPELADQVDRIVAELAEASPHADRVGQALTGEQSAIVLVRDLGQMIDVANAYAGEHLEIHTREPHQVADQIRQAGAIFIGPWSPVPLGDYSAGSTHVLPTGGTARFSSGLTARSFLKTVHLIDYSQAGLSEIGAGIERFALAEDLPGHGQAIAVRSSDGQ
jgi:histidinol dehydrogenase